MSSIPWAAIAEVVKEVAPAALDAIASGLRAQGFEIPRDPDEALAEGRSEFDRIVRERFHPNTIPGPPFDDEETK